MTSSPAQPVVEYARQTLIGQTGLISTLQQILASPGEPRIVAVSSITAALENISAIRIPGNQGAAGFTYEEAATGAVGETIERYCAACYEWDDLLYATADELGAAALGMDRFALYTGEVYDNPRIPLVRWRSDLPTYWVEAKSLHTGERRYVPAALVYTPFRSDNPRQLPPIAVAVSTGQACHRDTTTALLSGLCEAVERDAFMVTWMRRIPPQRIDFRADALLDGYFQCYFQCRSTEFHVFDITLDIAIPTVLCVTMGFSERGRFANVGCATHPCERRAVLKAMKEACQGASWARGLMESRPDWRPAPDFHNIYSFEDHVRLFCEPDMVQHMDFILKTERRRGPGVAQPDADDAEAGLRLCLSELERNGLEALVVDLTTPDIADLGFYVPKVMVPGLAHLTAAHLVQAVATPRYREVPRRLGFTGGVHEEFNPTPHPFP